MARSVHPDLADVPLTAVLAALSDPLRLGVVRLLADGSERQWGEFDAPVSKSTLSHHMKVLRTAGITATRAEGTRCYVHLRREELDEAISEMMATDGPYLLVADVEKSGIVYPMVPAGASISNILM